MSGSVSRVELLTRPDCPLCDEMKSLIDRVATELDVAWTPVDITEDPVLTERYGNDIPVLLIDGVVWLQHRTSEAELRSRLSRLR